MRVVYRTTRAVERKSRAARFARNRAGGSVDNTQKTSFLRGTRAFLRVGGQNHRIETKIVRFLISKILWFCNAKLRNILTIKKSLGISRLFFIGDWLSIWNGGELPDFDCNARVLNRYHVLPGTWAVSLEVRGYCFSLSQFLI